MALRKSSKKNKARVFSSSKGGGHGLMKVKAVEVVKVESKPKKTRKKKAKKRAAKKTIKKRVTKKTRAKKVVIKRSRGPVCILSRTELEKEIRRMIRK